MTPEFLLTSLIVVLMPGTGVLYTLSSRLFRGRVASIAAAFGCTLGILPHMTASMLGLAAVLHASALAFQLVKLAGVAYLLYLAWAMWRETGALRVTKSEDGDAGGLVQVAIRGFLINILNPKLSIFFLAFLPQFTPAHAFSPLWVMAGHSAVFMLMTFVVFVMYGVFASLVRTRGGDLVAARDALARALLCRPVCRAGPAPRLDGALSAAAGRMGAARHAAPASSIRRRAGPPAPAGRACGRRRPS